MERLTEKRDGKNVIPLRVATTGIDVPYWRLSWPRDNNLDVFLYGAAADKLAAYEDAEEHGLLVRLPCKVGDMVYYRRGRDILGDTVERLIIDGIDNQVLVGAYKVYRFCDFGKTVFLTREEAALKKGQDDA